MAANINYRLRLKQLPFMQGTAPAAVTAKQALLKHRNYPLYVAPKDLLTSFSANLPFLWLALYFQQAEVGLFGLALTFTFRPANILNGAFERALYARVAERVRQRQSIARTIRRFLLILNAIAIPAAIAAWFVAEPLFTFLFGSQWVGTGIYVQALLPWILVMLSTMSLMFIPNVFGTQRTEFLFGLVAGR
jgi:O-antigen/teichoic acid export membrane protein